MEWHRIGARRSLRIDGGVIGSQKKTHHLFVGGQGERGAGQHQKRHGQNKETLV